jgi:hypothetical protein
LAAGVASAALDPEAFFRAYLVAYTFWLALALGCLALAFMQFLTGGVWGLVVRRVCEAAAATLPLMTILFLPLLLGLARLYAWARPDAGTSELLQHQSLYLNLPFFLFRAVIYFATWSMLALLLNRWSRAQDHSLDARHLVRLQRLSVIGVLVLAITVSFAAIDWLMALEPDWHSTAYPPIIGAGALLLGMAFAILVVSRLQTSGPLRAIATPRVFNDLGSLLLAFLMLWAYISYFQYLLIWSGNLSDEIPWYLARLDGSWAPVAVIVAGIGFVVPFWMLIFRGIKRAPRWLGVVAAVLIAARAVDELWLVAPAFGQPALDLVLAYAALGVGLGGVWLAVFGWRLGALPLLPPNDPRLPAAQAAAHAHQ